MKKFIKLFFGSVVLASLAAGAYYIYKNFIKKDSSDDFDDFEDDFEEFDTEEDEDSESREYVPINIAGEESGSSKADTSPEADDTNSLLEDEQ